MKENSEAKLIYLKTKLETLKNRLFEERAARPLIAHLDTPDLLEDFIRKHLFERAFYYNQSEFVIDTDEKSPEEVVAEIVKLLN